MTVVLTECGVLRIVEPVYKRSHHLAVHMGCSEFVQRVDVISSSVSPMMPDLPAPRDRVLSAHQWRQ